MKVPLKVWVARVIIWSLDATFAIAVGNIFFQIFGKWLFVLLSVIIVFGWALYTVIAYHERDPHDR